MRFKALIMIFIPLLSYGQSANSLLAPSSVSGTIEMPSLVDLSVSSASSDRIAINTFEDFSNGKTFPSYFKIHVRSNRPWNISVMANTSNLLSTESMGQKLPVTLISLKSEANSDFVSLSQKPRPFMQNMNNKIENTYSVDLRIDPPLNYYGGNYDFNIIFIITAL
ncbi:MAG: hypothetical protein JSS96_17300 [Bacteroidetes bacterium]|nr:hypothetical protein [Bacteroidota bacterium]